MGMALSNLTEGNSVSNGPGLGDIPENCVACVFMNLTPPEICNLARLNRAFRSAASSDFVWESKLPSNYQYLLDKTSYDRTPESISKKNLFAMFSRSVSFDDGFKEFWVDRVTCGVCLSISAKALLITGIDDRRYWSWIPTEESRFHEVAFVFQMWWFEVGGILKFCFPPGRYTLFYRIHIGRFTKRLGRRICNFGHTHGWDLKPVKFEMSTSNGQQSSCEYFLDEQEKDDPLNNSTRGKWLEYEVGEFLITDSDTEIEIRFSMKQIDCTHPKGGICVDSVSILPSNLRRKNAVE